MTWKRATETKRIGGMIMSKVSAVYRDVVTSILDAIAENECEPSTLE